MVMAWFAQRKNFVTMVLRMLAATVTQIAQRLVKVLPAVMELFVRSLRRAMTDSQMPVAVVMITVPVREVEHSAVTA